MNVKELHSVFTDLLGDRYESKFFIDPVENTPEDEKIEFVSSDGTSLSKFDCSLDTVVFAEPLAGPIYLLTVLGFAHAFGISDQDVYQGMYVVVSRNEKPYIISSPLYLYVDLDWVKGFVLSNRMNWYTFDGSQFDTVEAAHEYSHIKGQESDELWRLEKERQIAEFRERHPGIPY